MPAKSQAQRAYLNMKFGHEWVKEHHFDNTGKLPEHEHESKPTKKRSVKSQAKANMSKIAKGLRA